jgi:hypothetical protein
MKNVLIAMLQALLAVLDEETVKGFMDKGLDFLEDKIAASPTQWDDTFVLPIINHARKVLDIPDNDEVFDTAPQ